MKKIQKEIAKEVIKEIRISPTGKRLILLTMMAQFPLIWFPFATQILTILLLGIALTHMTVVEKQ
jgi:hypothetical protein